MLWKVLDCSNKGDIFWKTQKIRKDKFFNFYFSILNKVFNIKNNITFNIQNIKYLLAKDV